MGRIAAVFAVLLAAAAARAGENPAGHPWIAGAYSFSDELGGFTILSASGEGTSTDPVIVTEEFESATPATMIIRAARPLRPFGRVGDDATGFPASSDRGP